MAAVASNSNHGKRKKKRTSQNETTLNSTPYSGDPARASVPALQTEQVLGGHVAAISSNSQHGKRKTNIVKRNTKDKILNPKPLIR